MVSRTLAALSLAAASTVTASAVHPLDPLTPDEIETVVDLLQREDYADALGLFPLITLEEPSKADVLKRRPGHPVPRRAFAIVKKLSETFEAVVDVPAREVLSWQRVAGVQPNVLMTEEWSYSQKIVLGNREWREALRKRGFANLGDVVCVPHSVGYHGVPEEEGKRLLRVVCYDGGSVKNFWGRPIEGLVAVVDLNGGGVIDIIDKGPTPVPKASVDFSEDAVGELRKPPRPISMSQPEGPSFVVEGQQVRWQNWEFHLRIDPRVGLVLSTVRYRDRGKARSVLYQGSLSELFVPYMDPGEGWYFKTYLDAGEYGVGKLAVSLEPGLDCPSGARHFDAVFAHDWGEPYVLERAACLFERYAGDVAWRHHEATNGESEVRKRVDLVLRLVSAIGNYDYIFDWVFQQDGNLRVAVGASGVEQVKAVESRSMGDESATQDTAFGRLVAEHTVAINHDHFFAFRLDLDVDGTRNSFVYEPLKRRRLPEDSPRRSVWVVEPRMMSNEQDARLRIDLDRPALWRVINPEVLGPVGYPVSYELKPGTNGVSLLSPDDYPQRRAGFTDFHLWVTPHHPRERYAAGIYPNQSKGGEGLPAWTSANRPIEDKDIVLWYTMGFHHVVRAEDWPVLPTSWSSFSLRPFDFFARNPALDLPRDER